jgi:membrane associated rhomboid family serine protease
MKKRSEGIAVHLFFLGPTFSLPAVMFLGWWFLLQFFNGALSLGARGSFGGVAWWAHVGGFAFGLLVGLFASRRPPASARFVRV